MLILLFFQLLLLLFNCTVGFVLSNLYVPLHAAVFHALSYAHKCKYLVHSVLFVSVAPLLYDVPFAQHCANVALAFHVQ